MKMGKVREKVGGRARGEKKSDGNYKAEIIKLDKSKSQCMCKGHTSNVNSRIG